MTKLDFVALCEELLIDPAIALESDEVKAALANNENVREALESEF